MLFLATIAAVLAAEGEDDSGFIDIDSDRGRSFTLNGTEVPWSVVARPLLEVPAAAVHVRAARGEAAVANALTGLGIASAVGSLVSFAAGPSCSEPGIVEAVCADQKATRAAGFVLVSSGLVLIQVPFRLAARHQRAAAVRAYREESPRAAPDDSLPESGGDDEDL